MVRHGAFPLRFANCQLPIAKPNKRPFMSRRKFKRPKVRTRDLARTLRYFRLIRGPGGMLDHGDRLEVALRADSHEDVVEIFAALGVKSVPQPPTYSPSDVQNVVFEDIDSSGGSRREPTPPGLVMIGDVPVNSILWNFELILSISDRDHPLEVTPAAIEDARSIEAKLDLIAERVTDSHKIERLHPAKRMLWNGIKLLVIAVIGWWLLADIVPGQTGAAFLIPGVALIIRTWYVIRWHRPKTNTPAPPPAPVQAQSSPASGESPPRIAYGHGHLPLHVHYIFQYQDGSYRIEIHDPRRFASRWGFYPGLKCANKAEFDAQIEVLITARVPFMIGHVIMGPSDDAYFWFKAKGRPINYLEILCGGQAAWTVREIIDDASEWPEQWQEAKLKDILGPHIDLFDPANRSPPMPTPAIPEPAPSTPPGLAPDPPPTLPPEVPVPTAPLPEPPPIPDAPPEPTPAAQSELPPLPTEPSPAAIADSAEPTAVVLPPSSPAATPSKPGKWLQHTAHVLLILIAGVAFYRITDVIRFQVEFDVAEVLPASLQWALLGSTIYIAFWLTAFSKAFPDWSDRLVLMANSFLIAIMVAFAMLFVVNVEQDHAPRIVVPTVVLEKAIYKGKYGRDLPEYWRYHLVVRSWKDDFGEERMTVARDDFDRAQPGDTVTFRLHPGRLGWFWYTNEELSSPGFVEFGKPLLRRESEMAKPIKSR
jgi:hypothetical protein